MGGECKYMLLLQGRQPKLGGARVQSHTLRVRARSSTRRFGVIILWQIATAQTSTCDDLIRPDYRKYARSAVEEQQQYHRQQQQQQ